MKLNPGDHSFQQAPPFQNWQSVRGKLAVVALLILICSLYLGHVRAYDFVSDDTFIPYLYRAIWEREKDFYDTDLLPKLYKSRLAEIVPGAFLNFYELREQYKTQD